MNSTATNLQLTGRTLLIAPSAEREIAITLECQGARVLSWPRLDIHAPETFAALDEAIENLFGYDWLIFRNLSAVSFFLARFQELGHDTTELDSVRVCAVGQEALQRLEASRVHVDIIPESLSTQSLLDAVENYIAGRGALHGLNFLVPGAGVSHTCLPGRLEDAGARADLVTTYQTCSTNDSYRISALLRGGAIDCVIFTNASEVLELAQLFDVNELGELLREVIVVCADQETTQCAAGFGLPANITVEALEALALANAIASYLDR